MKKTTLLLSSFISIACAVAQNTHNLPESGVIPCSEFHVSKPLSELFEKNPVIETEDIREKTESHDRDNRPAQVYKYKSTDGIEYGNDPSSVQSVMGNRQQMAPLTNWLGQNGGGSYPPDPSGAIGTNYYVQSVNATPFKVFNKTTGAQVGTVKQIGSLFGLTSNDGDPIVLYDKYADRWFLSQFGLSGNKIYIAISTTNDPTGTYYCYTFTSPAFPDYLKFSIWQDGYYMCSNGQKRAFAFDRAKMLVGDLTAKSVYATYTQAATGGFFCPLPADADGSLAPVGTACPFFAYTDNGWGGGAVDAVKIWNMTPNWTLATPTLTISPTVVTLPTAAFDASYDPNWDDITQPTAGYKLDGIGGVATFRAQWRKWTGYNSVVLNWGVLISSTTGQRSIKWVELRQNQTSGTWSLYQEGTYTPDVHSRWVGSIAMDDNGSIALCYAKASSTLSASLGYTGRLASDPLGTMTFAETIATTGSGTQTAANRFGDYSQTSLDPSDGVTFWHTGEYISSGNPATRVYSFKLPLSSGIDEIQNQSTVIVNQANGLINVNVLNLPSNDELVVDLFDITGKQLQGKKVVPSSNSLQTSFDVSGLASGTYLLRIGKQNSSFQKVTKIIVN